MLRTESKNFMLGLFLPPERNHHLGVVNGTYDMGQAATFELASIVPANQIGTFHFCLMMTVILIVKSCMNGDVQVQFRE